MREEGLEGLPLFAFGASSGGSLALRLASIMPEVAGVVCQISPVNPATLEVQGGDRPYPPTIFVHMAERDPEKAATVTQALKVLK
jgi:alpha-beta hydrolase superfamily lysophospholipase